MLFDCTMPSGMRARLYRTQSSAVARASPSVFGLEPPHLEHVTETGSGVTIGMLPLGTRNIKLKQTTSDRNDSLPVASGVIRSRHGSFRSKTCQEFEAMSVSDADTGS